MAAKPNIVARLVEQLSREIHDPSRLSGLDAWQWATLRCLARAGAAARTISHIAGYLGAPELLVCESVTALERKMLVGPSRPAVAGTIALTKLGQDLLRYDPVLHLEQAISQLTAADQSELARLVEELYARLAEERRARS